MSYAMSGREVFPLSRRAGVRAGGTFVLHPALTWLLPVAFLVLLLSVPVAIVWIRVATFTALPEVRPVDSYHLYVDDMMIPITIRGGTAPWDATATELRRDPRLWRRMDVTDWNGVDARIRADAFDAMLDRYRHVLTTPAVWDRMNQDDWDRVPQPIRTLAYREMIAYWAGFYHLGGDTLDPVVVRETLAAIVMQESWFDHRAVSVSRNGNRDLGLAQASDYARARMRQLAAEGRVDVVLADADYFDPWKATRFLALWMRELLAESSGDLDVAVRAYHRGTGGAHDGRGTAYFDLVRQRLSRFIRNHDAPAAWSEIWHRGRLIERDAWPWLHRQEQ